MASAAVFAAPADQLSVHSPTNAMSIPLSRTRVREFSSEEEAGGWVKLQGDRLIEKYNPSTFAKRGEAGNLHRRGMGYNLLVNQVRFHSILCSS
jgi:hypothetical protein